MIPALKSCYVLLNRNYLDSEETIRSKNDFPKVEIKNCNQSYQSKSSDHKTRSPKIIKKYSKVENEELMKYSSDINSESEDSDSEFSCGSSSDDGGSSQAKEKPDLKTTNQKKLRCLPCNKFFTTHSSYLCHKRGHKSKPFKCILCRKGCENRQSFLNHMKKLHPEVDPFVCEYPGCEQNFKTQKRLEIHRKMHFRYMCKYCKMLFGKKHFMKKHVLNVH